MDEETKALHVDKGRMAYLPRWIQEFVFAHEIAHVKGWGKVGAYWRQVLLWPGVLWGKNEILRRPFGAPQDDRGEGAADEGKAVTVTGGDSHRRSNRRVKDDRVGGALQLPEVIPIELSPFSPSSPFAEFLREIAFSERSLLPAAAVVEPGAGSHMIAEAA